MVSKTKNEGKNFLDLLQDCTGGEVITISKYIASNGGKSNGSPFDADNASSVAFQIALYFVYARRANPSLQWGEAEAVTLREIYKTLGVTVFENATDGDA